MGFKTNFAASLGLSLASTAVFYYNNDMFEIANYQLDKGLALPIRIVCISDLHDKQFGRQNSVLLAAVRECQPSLILLTGDTVTTGAKNLARTCEFLAKLSDIAPVFSNLGNHELRDGRGEQIALAFRKSGVRVLRNELAQVETAGQSVHILGLCENQGINRRDYLLDMVGLASHENHDAELSELAKCDGVRLVLSHFPENFSRIGENSYCRHRFDVMFSGHTHGGQIRLPKIGGVFAPGQGLLPMYDRGFFRRRGNALLVSGGLGNDGPIPRINNRPQLVVLTIK